MHYIHATFFILKINTKTQSEVQKILDKLRESSLLCLVKNPDKENANYRINGFTLRDFFKTIEWICIVCADVEISLGIISEVKLGYPIAEKVVQNCCRVKL